MKYFVVLLFAAALLFAGCKDNPVEVKNASVSFSAPLSSEITGDSVLILINAFAESGIAGVDFYLNGTLTKSWSEPPYSFYLNLSSYSDSTNHTFQAKVKPRSGAEQWSSPRSVLLRKLKAPTDLLYNSVGRYSFRLLWTDNNAIETGYRIEVNKNKTGFVTLAQLAANTTAYTVENRDTVSRFEYRIAAVKDSLLSSFSQSVSVLFSAENYTSSLAVKAFPGSGNSIAFVSVETGQLINSAAGHAGTITWLKYSPDDSLLGSRSDDNTIKIWNTADQSLVASVLLFGITKNQRTTAGNLLCVCPLLC